MPALQTLAAKADGPILYRESVSEGSGTDFVISDGSRDRHGTRINPNGWDLTPFRRHPVALFAHGKDALHGSIPIGTWSDLRVEGGRLLGRLILAAEGTSARIDELRKLVSQGILRAVSVGFSVIEEGKPGKSEFDFERQELLEASLVSVPSNKNALAVARSLNISNETMSLVFGEHAEMRLRDVTTTGEHAATSRIRKTGKMTTLSQRIEGAQNELTAKRDKLVELNAADALDLDAIEALNETVEEETRALAIMKRSEAQVAATAAPAGTITAPAINRRPLGFPQREVPPLDLLVRKAIVRGCSHFGEKPIERVLDERYPGHEATALMVRADQTIGTTTVAGWALELMQTSYSAFVDALRGKSIYPELRSRGMGISFDQAGTAYIPSLTAGGANGSFFGEGAPMRVGRITTAATTMTSRKMGVIIPFSREAAKRSTPSLEGIIREAIVGDTAAVLDAALLDAVAGDSVRPAGLLNGVAATAAGFGGGDYQAVIADFTALMAPFNAANAMDGITVIMNPTQGFALSMMPGPGDGRFDWAEPIRRRLTIVESTHATAGRLIAIRNSDFVTALGDAPDFEMSNTATIHMEDTTPLEIVSGTGPTTADPVRSFFQTDTMGIRMVLDVAWKMRRTGMVSWINGTSW